LVSESLLAAGYARTTARTYSFCLAAFGRWLVDREIDPSEIDETVVQSFLEERSRDGKPTDDYRTALPHLLTFMRRQDAIGAPAVVEGDPHLGSLLAEYGSYLRQERGLVQRTIVGYVRVVQWFLLDRFGDLPPDLRKIDVTDISSFMVRHLETRAPSGARRAVSALRSFFRFLLEHAHVDVDLVAAVPPIRVVHLAGLPRHLAFGELDLLLAASSRETAVGRRDRAILLLLARLGLRAGEVVSLSLDDIDWRAGVITVSGKGLGRDRLPLTDEVGEALASYLQRGRPASSSRRVFLRSRAPYRGFAGPSTVSTIVRHALERAGLQPPSWGAHLLRHTLATELLCQRASMTEIGELLRHRSIKATEIYAKVDITGLRDLALPWPDRGYGR